MHHAGLGGGRIGAGRIGAGRIGGMIGIGHFGRSGFGMSHHYASRYRGGRYSGGGGGGGGFRFSVPEVITPEQAAFRDACDVYDDQFNLPQWSISLSALARFVLFVALPLTGASIGTAWYQVFVDLGSNSTVARLVGTSDNSNCAYYYYYSSAFSSCWGLHDSSNSSVFGDSNVVTTRGFSYIVVAALVILNDVVLIMRALCSRCWASAAPSQFGIRAAFIDTVQAGVGAVALIAAGASFSSSAVSAALDAKFDCTTSCTSMTSETPGYQLSIAACALYLTGAALLAFRCAHLMNMHAAWIRSPGAQAAEPVLTNVPAVSPMQLSAIKVAQFLITSGQMDFMLEKTEQMYAEAGNPPEGAEPDPLDLYSVALKKWGQPVPFRADTPPNSTLVPMCFESGGVRKRLLVVVEPTQVAILDSGNAAAFAYMGRPLGMQMSSMSQGVNEGMQAMAYPPSSFGMAAAMPAPPMYGQTAVNMEPQIPTMIQGGNQGMPMQAMAYPPPSFGMVAAVVPLSAPTMYGHTAVNMEEPQIPTQSPDSPLPEARKTLE